SLIMIIASDYCIDRGRCWTLHAGIRIERRPECCRGCVHGSAAGRSLPTVTEIRESDARPCRDERAVAGDLQSAPRHCDGASWSRWHHAGESVGKLPEAGWVAQR